MSARHIHKEIAFEDQIEAHLLDHGWLKGRDQDPSLALDPTHLFAFIQQTQPELWQRLHKQHGDALGKRILAEIPESDP